MIRYNKSLNNEINRVVRNFNNKVKRLEKSKKDLIIPERVNVKDLKKKVYNRRDLYYELEKLKSFSKRGIEKTVKTLGGSKISLYELENIKKDTRRIKNRLSREIRLKEITKPRVFGKIQDVTFAEMGDSSYLNLKARREALDKNIEKLTPEELKRYIGLLEKSTWRRRYDFNNLQYNFAYEMLIPLAYLTNYPIDKIEETSRKLATLKEEHFLDLFNNEMVMKAITEYYAEARRGNESMNDDVAVLLNELNNSIDDLIKEYE